MPTPARRPVRRSLGPAEPTDPGPDLRLPCLAGATWAGSLLGSGHGWWALLPAVPVALVLLGTWWVEWHAPEPAGSRDRRWWTRLVCVLLLVAVAGAVVAALHAAAQNRSPLHRDATARSALELQVRVRGTPRPLTARVPGTSERVLVPVTVLAVNRGPLVQRVRVDAVLLGGRELADLRYREVWAARVRLAPGHRRGELLGAVRDGLHRTAPAAAPYRAAAGVRAAIRRAVSGAPPAERALVPALVAGDDAGLPDEVEEAFRSTGLTHLLAVSGTNLTLVVGAGLWLARWCGVRGRWQVLVGALGVLGFVLLAGPEPSVLRAAVMGSVALLGLGLHGTDRALRALGACVTVLVLLQPHLASQPGFVLSVLATAGILVWVPGWAERMAWCPRWLALALTVPTAAQLACTPVVAALSGQVSLVAVAANMLAAPAVAPATVLGLLGGLTGLVRGWLGALVARPAVWCVGWIVAVARHGADLPHAALGWGTGPVALAVLTLVCGGLVLLVPRVLASVGRTLAAGLLLLGVVVVPTPTPGWPPADWAVVACDVGQGDALLLRAGPHSAVLVDAGPDPAAVDRCLDRMQVDQVPIVLVSHFDADHVAGLGGVWRGRRVARVETSALARPEAGAATVQRLAREAGVPVAVASLGSRRIGDLTLQVLASGTDPVSPEPNDGSVLALAETGGVVVLLTGDLGAEAQRRAARAVGDVDVDVLKVPHHGSRDQDHRFLVSTRPEIALTSVGADNTYGHPAPQTLTALTSVGTRVARTDRSGDLVVRRGPDGGLQVVTSG